MVEAWIHDWGYLAVAVGAFAEGETVLLAAGWAARHGLLEPLRVVLVAALAATAGDQVFYLIGRRFGGALLRRFPGLGARFDRVGELLHRYPRATIVGLRFAWGLRIAGPVALGAARVPARLFTLYNALGALLWAPLVTAAGWTFGAAAERFGGVEAGIAAAALVLGVLLARRL